MNRTEANDLLRGLRDCDETQGGVLRALKVLIEAAVVPCPGCNDEGVVHDGEGRIVGPCTCVEPVAMGRETAGEDDGA